MNIISTMINFNGTLHFPFTAHRSPPSNMLTSGNPSKWIYFPHFRCFSRTPREMNSDRMKTEKLNVHGLGNITEKCKSLGVLFTKHILKNFMKEKNRTSQVVPVVQFQFIPPFPELRRWFVHSIRLYFFVYSFSQWNADFFTLPSHFQKEHRIDFSLLSLRLELRSTESNEKSREQNINVFRFTGMKIFPAKIKMTTDETEKIFAYNIHLAQIFGQKNECDECFLFKIGVNVLASKWENSPHTSWLTTKFMSSGCN